MSHKTTQTQREEPAPKKNLAKAKDASKIYKEPEKAAVKPVDPKKGTGNNSAHPGRPEREADRKGRTYPRKSGTGRGREDKRDGKEWGEGRMGKRVEDGVGEAAAQPALGGEAAPTVQTDGEGTGEAGRGRGGRPGGRGGREREIVELTPEQEAALKAEREAEERQMTLEEWQAKKAGTGPAVVVELKEARKIEADPALKARKQEAEATTEWAGKKAVPGQQKKKEQKQGKTEKLVLGAAPPRRNNSRRDDASSPGAGRGGQQQQQRGAASAPALAADDFPALGAKPAAKN